jgi:hypothetical protein
MTADPWPQLPLDEWLPTYATLHRWMQIVGKTRMVLAPFENHWWHCTLYVTARGLTTSPVPVGKGVVDVELDIVNDVVVARGSWGQTETMRLESKSVATFYEEWQSLLAALGVRAQIVTKPNEVADAIPFAEDHTHATYDGDAARRWWRALTHADRALKRFRGQFTGKCSPSHFWWGGFDLACTRFSGRRAPPHAGGVPNCPDFVMHEAYSHECISAGWWPGTAGSPIAEPAFYAYAYPEPDGCQTAPIQPAEARYDLQMKEWILPYAAVRASDAPDGMIMAFLQSTYVAAATLAKWDIASLSRRAAEPVSI